MRLRLDPFSPNGVSLDNSSVTVAGGSSSSSGVTSLAKSGSTALTGAVTLSQGSNITLTQVGQDIAIAATSGGSGTVNTIVAGNNINVDATDPANPIVAVDTLTLADVSDITASATELNYTSGVTSAIQTQLDAKVDENAAIVGATKTKITYDTKGLVTAGADATTADIADSLNKRYVTDANLTVIGNTSGTNTGDQTSIVGITGTKAQFDTAVTDGNILYVGDVTQYTDEMAQDAVGVMIADTATIDLTYTDATPELKADVKDASITYAKIQNVSATDKVLGRTTAGAGSVEEIATTGSGNVVRATSPTLVTPALGTPSSATLTNATGLPVAGITSSTSTALGVGSLELGHATDTTLSRSSAGVLAVEGSPVVTTASSSNTLPTGSVVQIVTTTSTAVATGATTIPLDDTIPQNTEGNEFMTLAITPKSTTNTLIIDVVAALASDAAAFNMIGAIFQDTTANALAADTLYGGTASASLILHVRHVMAAGTTSSTTFKFRGGANTGTTTFNGRAAGRLFGAITKSSIVITEVKA